ncbi:CDC16 protein [Cladophialophora chaetospira]|uniref:CDC16 protein n=1 Tax=Cladophialophora chaetospira TaxID=386627 RepID=A0AA39CNT9_9EURO|nr:CDC16 protein [Cladophialophora chaetospira]
MTATTSHSPRKVFSRNALLPSPDPASIRLPDSPEKNNLTSSDKTRGLRRLQSHNQLSSTANMGNQSSNLRPPRSGIPTKPSREQLNQPASSATNSNNNMSTTASTSRVRANSDAPMPYVPRVRKPPPTSLSNPSSNHILTHARKSSLEMTLRDGPPPGTNAPTALSLLRHSILTGGVSATKEGMSDYRIYLWLTLLNIGPLSTDTYLGLIHRGRSPAYEKISNDVFRTLATDTLFKRRVTDASLTRVLNATAWRIHDEQSSNPPSEFAQRYKQSTYLQGLNVLSAPLLYASRSEAQAYAIMTRLLTEHIPTYLSPAMSGVHQGLDLIDRILAEISPALSAHLLSKGLQAKIYAFAPVTTLCAGIPPLPEVLKLWDFLFAFGAHLNVICVVAQLLMLKDKLIAEQSPGKMLRNFPNLNADEVIKMTVLIVKELSDELYRDVVMHGREVS